MKRIILTRRLTPEEVAKYNKIREQVEQEFPPMAEFITCTCGQQLPRISTRCPYCKKTRTHRECHPDQYTHPLCGKKVKVRTSAGFTTEGVVERVVGTRWGPLAHLDNSGDTAYHVSDCKET